MELVFKERNKKVVPNGQISNSFRSDLKRLISIIYKLLSQKKLINEEY